MRDPASMEMMNTYQAKTQLSRLLERAAAGEDIVIAKAGKPIARLIAYIEPTQPQKEGELRGHIHIAANFDDPLPPEIAAPFEGL